MIATPGCMVNRGSGLNENGSRQSECGRNTMGDKTCGTCGHSPWHNDTTAVCILDKFCYYWVDADAERPSGRFFVAENIINSCQIALHNN